MQHNAPYDLEYRIIRPDGTERVIRTQAETTLDQNSKVVCLTGTAPDVTEEVYLGEIGQAP